MKKIKLLAISALAALSFNGCYLTTIDSTETGVEKSWGEVQKDSINAGLAFNMMPGTDVIPMRTANKVANFVGSEDREDSQAELNTNSIAVLTEQQLPIPLDVSVMYQLSPKMAPQMLATVGPDGVWDNMLIIKETRSSVRDAIGQVSLEALNSKRDEFESKILTLMNSKLAKYGVTVTNISIRNIGIPNTIKEAVLAKETSKQNAEKAKYQVEQAVQEAQIEIAKAKGIADANNILSGSLTQQLVSYKQLEIQRIQAEKWNGALPTTVTSGNTGFLMNLK